MNVTSNVTLSLEQELNKFSESLTKENKILFSGIKSNDDKRRVMIFRLAENDFPAIKQSEKLLLEMISKLGLQLNITPSTSSQIACYKLRFILNKEIQSLGKMATLFFRDCPNINVERSIFPSSEQIDARDEEFSKRNLVNTQDRDTLEPDMITTLSQYTQYPYEYQQIINSYYWGSQEVSSLLSIVNPSIESLNLLYGALDGHYLLSDIQNRLQALELDDPFAQRYYFLHHAVHELTKKREAEKKAEIEKIELEKKREAEKKAALEKKYELEKKAAQNTQQANKKSKNKKKKKKI